MLKEISAKVKETFSPEKTSLSDQDLCTIEKKLAACSKDMAGAISGMINLNVGVARGSLDVVLFDDLPKQLNTYDESVVMLYNGVLGTTGGSVIFYAPINELVRITEIFLHKAPGYFRDINDKNISVIKEFSTILADYYITALDVLFDRDYATSDPALSAGLYKITDKIKEYTGAVSFDAKKTYFVVFQTDFSIDDDAMKLKALLLLRASDVEELLRAVNDDA